LLSLGRRGDRGDFPQDVVITLGRGHAQTSAARSLGVAPPPKRFGAPEASRLGMTVILVSCDGAAIAWGKSKHFADLENCPAKDVFFGGDTDVLKEATGIKHLSSRRGVIESREIGQDR